MSKAKFDAARELILEKRYDEARIILKTMDHPSARKWLNRLDEIDPPFPQVKPGPHETDIPEGVDQTVLNRITKTLRFQYIAGGTIAVIAYVYLFMSYLGSRVIISPTLLVIALPIAIVGLFFLWAGLDTTSIQQQVLLMKPQKLERRLVISGIAIIIFIPILTSTDLLSHSSGFLGQGLVIAFIIGLAKELWLIQQLKQLHKTDKPTVVNLR